jgi:hypothetical protein
MPFIKDPRGMAVIALVLGFAACSVGASATRNAPVIVTIANVLGPVTLGLGIATLITGNEWLLAGTIGTIVLLWIMATVRHAIYGWTTSTTPPRRRSGHRRVTSRGGWMNTKIVDRPNGRVEKAPQAQVASGLRWARLLSVVIVILMAVASAAGLSVDGLYQDPDSVSAMLRGYDLVTLAVAVPVLAVTLLPALRQSARAQLLWVGMLAYSVYNYANYVFGTAFNDVFLVHVALFSLSVFALALAMMSLDIPGIARQFSEHTPVRSVSAILMLLAFGLAAMWVFFSLRFAINGEFPDESLLVLPAANVHLGYVLDLALLVPAAGLAAILLWRRAALGYVLATVVAAFCVVYQLNYTVALIFQAAAGRARHDSVRPAGTTDHCRVPHRDRAAARQSPE